MNTEIKNFLQKDCSNIYFVNQLICLNREREELDESWIHSTVIDGYLSEAIDYIEKSIKGYCLKYEYIPIYERKIEKYFSWIEVCRLAKYQYGRYSTQHTSYTEALYSTLNQLIFHYSDCGKKEVIAVIGCGPGRTVADLALNYSNSIIFGLDYSLLSLVLAKKILIEQDTIVNIPYRDVDAENTMSSTLSVPSFGFSNITLGLFDIMNPSALQFDMIVCSNTINLMPDHEKAIDNLKSLVKTNGIIIFADLVGWRLDRQRKQKVIHSMKSIIDLFESKEIKTLDYFKAGPYVEVENIDTRNEYMEYFYVGIKEKN